MSEEKYDAQDKFGYPDKEWGQVEFRDKDGNPMSSEEFMLSIGLEPPEGGWGDGPPDAEEAAEDRHQRRRGGSGG